ncbi:MAG: cysteine hydrolase [Candidatus Methanoplasma sp.]|jgi:nicotinamidase-related amidase|nr:cysteine hydrolase [Candidatus Methanoplasma sp.]
MPRALVVVDYQTDFVTGSLGSPQAEAIEGNIVSKIEEYLESGGEVFFTRDTHGGDYLSTDEGAHIPVEHCVRGTPGWHIYGKVSGYLSRAKIIEKGTFGSLEMIRELNGFDTIEICGVATNVCVIANAVILKTAYPDSRVTVDPECVASYDEDLHRKALDVMRSLSIDIRDV